MANQWIIYALLSAIFASLVAIFSKIGLKNVDADMAAALKAFVMFLFLILVVFLHKKMTLINEFRINDYLFIFLAGISGAISWIFYFLALKQGITTKVASLDKTSLIFVMIFSILFLGEKFSWKAFIGILTMVVGAILAII